MKFKDLEKLVGRLGPLRLATLVESHLGRGRKFLPEDAVAPGHFLFLVLAATLAARRPVNDEQQDFLLRKYGWRVVNHGHDLDTAMTTRCETYPTKLLCILDGCFARCAGDELGLDLRSGDEVARPELPPVETTTFDLTALYVRAKQQIEKG